MPYLVKANHVHDQSLPNEVLLKLVIFTIVLDGMPFIEWQYECFKKLKCDWKWIVVEGTAQNRGSTKWCNPQKQRISNDGTYEFLSSIKDGRVIKTAGFWDSKDQMVNVALTWVFESCVLMQIDVDEIWRPDDIERIVSMFDSDKEIGEMKFKCRYFVGPNLVCSGLKCWSNFDYEWIRAWRFEPGMFFETHEPPKMNRLIGRTYDSILTFDHLGYIHEKQVAYKEQFYGYAGLLNQWRALQRNTVWPAKLSRFFPFVHGQMPVVHKIA